MRPSHLHRSSLLQLALALLALPALAKVAEAPPAPVARVEPVTDVHFGESVVDRYRWMENDKDPDWLPFLRGQNAHARALLEHLPERDALLKRISALSGDAITTTRVQRAGGKVFFQQRPAGANNFKLFVREGGKDRVLVDPTAIAAPSGGHMSLDWWKAAPDGSLVAYGLSADGSEDSVLHVLQVANGRDLPERIPNTENAQPSWLPDGKGFFYNQLTGKVGTPERYLDSQARFHKLGTDPGADPVLVRRGLATSPNYERIQAPYLVASEGSDEVVLELSDVRDEMRLLTAPLADVLKGSPRWAPAAEFSDEVTDFAVDGADLYLLVNKGTARGKLVKTAAAKPALASARLVVPEGQLVLESLSRAKDGIYLTFMDGGVQRLKRLGRDGYVSDVALPFEGTISKVFAEPEVEGALLALTGWLQPAGIWSVDRSGKVTDTGLNPRPPIDLSPYEATRRFAQAKDGTRIPYTVITRKGLKLDGSAPTFVSAYGSYGHSITPNFRPRDLAFLDAGGVVAWANVRGGGEYGRPWHKAGQLANKPNTWRDLIAVCEELIATHYTSARHLAIGGRSAGGITVGRAMTERPDLFAAVISGVGWSNPLRYVAEQNGYGEEPEWGAIRDEAGFRALKSIDSYQAVKDGTAYPAVLLTTGVTDPRVAPFHVAKMAARLQAATSSGKPVLLRVDFDAGHGMGSTRTQQDTEAADTFAFILWQAGAK